MLWSNSGHGHGLHQGLHQLVDQDQKESENEAGQGRGRDHVKIVGQKVSFSNGEVKLMGCKHCIKINQPHTLCLQFRGF